jgi:ubiquinone biosynthesis protein Coq4
MLNILKVGCSKSQPQSQPKSRQGMNWRELGKAYQVFMTNPAKGIRHILAAGRHSYWQKLVMARLHRQAKFIVDREVIVDLDALSQLPADTLGGAYARHMFAQGFTTDSFADNDQDTVFEKRLGIAHDVHHIMTGFDSSPIGEFGLAAFMLVQYRDLLNVFVLSWVPWSMLGNVRWIPKLTAALWRGFVGGWCSRSLAAYPFEDNWHKSILEVRRELGILTIDHPLENSQNSFDRIK